MAAPNFNPSALEEYDLSRGCAVSNTSFSFLDYSSLILLRRAKLYTSSSIKGGGSSKVHQAY